MFSLSKGSIFLIEKVDIFFLEKKRKRKESSVVSTCIRQKVYEIVYITKIRDHLYEFLFFFKVMMPLSFANDIRTYLSLSNRKTNIDHLPKMSNKREASKFAKKDRGIISGDFNYLNITMVIN